jgi:hypothetical protein
MSLEDDLELLEESNKMILLTRARQNVRIAMEVGISEEDAKAIFYKGLIGKKN